jgi:TatD DNase family protein
MFVDSHCHLDRIEELAIDDVMSFARKRRVEHCLCVCVSVNDFDKMVSKVTHLQDVSVSCGVHPLHQDEACEKTVLLEKASHSQVVAIGETGLDYHYSPENKAVQIASFIDHIAVANQLNKPLIIHTRAAKQDTLDILKQENASHAGGVLHCFTEDWPMAKAALDLGLYISISGIVTFKSAADLKETCRKIPSDRLLIETDSPWLAPVP